MRNGRDGKRERGRGEGEREEETETMTKEGREIERGMVSEQGKD